MFKYTRVVAALALAVLTNSATAQDRVKLAASVRSGTLVTNDDGLKVTPGLEPVSTSRLGAKADQGYVWRIAGGDVVGFRFDLIEGFQDPILELGVIGPMADSNATSASLDINGTRFEVPAAPPTEFKRLVLAGPQGIKQALRAGPNVVRFAFKDGGAGLQSFSVSYAPPDRSFVDPRSGVAVKLLSPARNAVLSRGQPTEIRWNSDNVAPNSFVNLFYRFAGSRLLPIPQGLACPLTASPGMTENSLTWQPPGWLTGQAEIVLEPFVLSIPNPQDGLLLSSGGPLSSFFCSKDFRRVCVYPMNARKIRIYDLPSSQVIREFKQEAQAYYSWKMMEDGKHVIELSKKDEVSSVSLTVYDIDSGKAVIAKQTPFVEFPNAWYTDGTRVFVHIATGIHVWNIDANSLGGAFPAESVFTSQTEFVQSPDGKLLSVVTTDGGLQHVALIDLEQFKAKWAKTQSIHVMPFAFGPDTQKGVLADHKRPNVYPRVLLLNTETGDLLRTLELDPQFKGYGAKFHPIQFISKGTRLVSIENEGVETKSQDLKHDVLRIRNLSTGIVEKSFTIGPAAAVETPEVFVSPDERFALCSRNQSLPGLSIIRLNE
ncbi:MAG: WD40 repeat domain-containing protein [Isosphaeraceae bacterium]